MNNDHIIKIINENGVPTEYGRFLDLWHIAQAVGTGKGEILNRGEAFKMVLEVWHMAHDFKAIAEGQGLACIVECVEPERYRAGGE